MLDNRHFRGGGVQHLRDMGTLNAVTGIRDSVHVSGGGNSLCLNSRMDTGAFISINITFMP